MRKGGSKPKGGAAEREVARLLSLWWTDGETDDIFYLTAGSGARQTVRRKQQKETANSAGDLSYLDVSGKLLIDHFLFEIKRGYNKILDIMSIADASTARKADIILHWLEKAEEERRDNKRSFVALIIRRDYKEYCITIPVELVTHLSQFAALPTPVKTLRLQERYLMMPLQEFFLWVQPHQLKVLLSSLAQP